jgi:phage repressor protein C with HTH and peptisase S24 domain
MALGKQIKKYRKQKGWDQKTLSFRSGVEVGTISALEVRDSAWSRHAAAIAKALGLTIEQLEDEDTDHNLGEPSSNAWQQSSETIQQSHKVSESTLGYLLTDIVIRNYNTSNAREGEEIVLLEQPGLIKEWRVSDEWVRLNVHRITSPRNLAIVTGFGPSMQPYFNPGDPLLIDIGINAAKTDGVYFFRVGHEGFVKQLQRIPTPQGLVIRAKSYNPLYDPFDITENMDFQVYGRVVKVWKGEEL